MEVHTVHAHIHMVKFLAAAWSPALFVLYVRPTAA